MAGLITAIAGAAAKEITKPAMVLIKKHGREAYHDMMLEYSKCFDNHVAAALDKCSNVKNILYKDQSAPLMSQYVGIKFSQGLLTKPDSEILEDVILGGRLLISGTAGAGKTMFMKWAVIHLIEGIQRHNLIPLFLELRYITEGAISKGLPDVLYNATTKIEGKVSFELFRSGLEAGAFVVVLDAVDEIKQEEREAAIHQIRDFISDYPDCPLLISTRPDDALESIQEITVVRSCSMDESQIVAVINKLDYDRNVKARLIQKLEEGLFDKHQEFLSNPLLATIMLLTFDHSADIPTKITAFYKQAFEALYQRHDAAKGAYRRGHHAGLPLDEYERIFSVFCFDSYIDSRVSFGDGELLSYFREAALYYDNDVDPTLLVRDAMESVCVIQREGLDNVFVHRSFQEYFAALFLTRYNGDDFAQQLDAVNRSNNERNILTMLVELAADKVEEKWLIDKLKPTVAIIRNARPGTKTGFNKIFKALYNDIGIKVHTGKIESYKVTHSGRGMGRAATWLNSIQAAYGKGMSLIGSIFLSEVIFSNLTDYLKVSGNEEYLPSLLDRVEVRPAHNDKPEEEFINVNEKDVDWLLESGLPTALGNVRDAIVLFYDDMEKRMEHRKLAMQRISVRNRMPRS